MKKYFEEVKVYDSDMTQLFAICKKPRKLPLIEYEKALNTEFNMEYPGGYKHNKQEKIVKTIMEQHQ